jgi:hypothetical protein
MGAWGEHNFQNDDALDWVYELESADDLSVVAKAIREVTEFDSAGYLESPECSRALAAAEVLAALLDTPSNDLPPEAKQWVDRHHDESPDRYISSALAAIGRIKINSEMKELWDETDYASSWYNVLDDLEGRLGK